MDLAQITQRNRKRGAQSLSSGVHHCLFRVWEEEERSVKEVENKYSEVGTDMEATLVSPFATT